MTKLVRQLRFAHAAEIAAYHAYEGHWRSTSNQAEQKYIQGIQLDELEHIHVIEQMLGALKSKPSKAMDFFGKIVGETIGLACFYSGWRLPMLVAGLMEKIGTASYKDIAISARKENQPIMAIQLTNMAQVEQEHEDYFEQLRKAQ